MAFIPSNLSTPVQRYEELKKDLKFNLGPFCDIRHVPSSKQQFKSRGRECAIRLHNESKINAIDK